MSCLTSRSHQWGRHPVTLTAAPPPVGGACNATSFPVESRFCCQSQHTLLCFQAPCRKLLNSALRGLELTVIQSDRDIYIPNCNTHGFYRKKQVGSPDRHPPILPHLVYSPHSFTLAAVLGSQCRSSKGTQRGHCWCVDELGAPLPSRGGGDTLPCDGE